MKELTKIMIFIFLSGCVTEKSEIPEEQPVAILLYMVADNNLNYFANLDVAELKAGWRSNPKYKPLVYLDGLSSPKHPILFTFNRDSFYQDSIQILKTYPEQNSASSLSMAQVILDAKNFLPNHRWRLILWSHGSAWLPNSSALSSGKDRILTDPITEKILTKSYGLDQTEEMSIIDLQRGIAPHFFEWIGFDACYMGNVETLYQLRNHTDYFIASPTEVLSTGFPYTKIYSYLFLDDSKESTLKIAETYLSHYQSKQGVFQSASIGVTLSKSLEDVREAFFNQKLDFSNSDQWLQYDIHQQKLLFDLGEQIGSSFLSETVLFHGNTSKFLSTLDLTNSSGLSVSIPYFIPKLKTDYEKLSWHITD